MKSGTCVVTVEEEETKNKASIEIVINEKTLPPPLSFNPYDKQIVGFDNNPLYSTDHWLQIKSRVFAGIVLRSSSRLHSSAGVASGAGFIFIALFFNSFSIFLSFIYDIF